MAITMLHPNSAKVENGVFKVDRKFHVGMQAYAQGIRAPLVTVHPEVPGEATMDPIEVPVSELPYGVMTFKVDRARRPLPAEIHRLSRQIAASEILYGDGFGCAPIARKLGIPYILVLEYDLQTQVTMMTANVPNILRRAIRTARSAWQYRSTIPDMRGAHSLHCNGYPIYDATRKYNSRSLLYLDSRMAQSVIMPPEELTARLATRTSRPMRVLFSGRYEPMKGTGDAVRVGVECLRRGLDIEMHLFGQGSLRSEMEHLAQQAPAGRIQIHDALPYPELVTVSRTFDLFVCCHIQSDPSCTYLESFGAGLPVVGYANRMWKRLSETSRVGLVAPMGQPEVADCVERLLSHHQTLTTMSERALAFAQDHCYELEFAKRINAVNEAIHR